MVIAGWLAGSAWAFGDAANVHFTANQSIPDGDPNGAAFSGNVSGLAGTISGRDGFGVR